MLVPRARGRESMMRLSRHCLPCYLFWTAALRGPCLLALSGLRPLAAPTSREAPEILAERWRNLKPERKTKSERGSRHPVDENRIQVRQPNSKRGKQSPAKENRISRSRPGGWGLTDPFPRGGWSPVYLKRALRYTCRNGGRDS